MPKKKTVKTKAAAPKPEAKSKLLAAVALKWLDGEDDPVESLRKALGVDKPMLDRMASGDLLPTKEQLKLLEALVEANPDLKPGDKVKPRQPNEDEAAFLGEVTSIADMTAHPSWAKLGKELLDRESEIRRSFDTCKPAELRLLQGELRGLKWIRDWVLEPARELQRMKLFAPNYVIKANSKALRVTVSAK